MVKNTKSVVQNFTDTFEGLGCITGKQHISLREDRIPAVYPSRKPVALRELMCKELQRLAYPGVLTKTAEPIEWAHPMVTVHKTDHSLRLRTDPK